MATRFNKEKFKAFMIRRRINAFSLIVLTIMSALVTMICSLSGYASEKLDLMVMVTIALVLLCFIQAIKLRKSFRTIRSFKGFRRKKKVLKDA